MGREYNDEGLIIYEGEFMKGLYHGIGKHYNDEGQIIYEGKFM